VSATPPPDYIVASGSLPEGAPVDFYARLAGAARTIHARVVLDTSGEPLRSALSERFYLLKPNRREAEELLRRPLADEADLADALSEFVRSGRAEIVIVSLGAKGAMLATREGPELLSAPEVPVVSRIGAGDSMVGGIVLALARGEPVREAALLGLAAGSGTVMSPGTGLCQAADVWRLYADLCARPHAARAS
jgi:6-phosphofructokinase 2